MANYKNLFLIVFHVHYKSVQLCSYCFYPGTLADRTASIWNVASLIAEKKEKWQTTYWVYK